MMLARPARLQWSRRRFAVAVLADRAGVRARPADVGRERELRQRDRAHRRRRSTPMPGCSRAESFGPFTGPATMPVERARRRAPPPRRRRADPVAVLRATTTTPSRRNVNLLGVVPGGVGAPRGAGPRDRAARDGACGREPRSRGRRPPRPERQSLPRRRGDARADLLRRHPDRDRVAGRGAAAGAGRRPLATAIVTRGRPRRSRAASRCSETARSRVISSVPCARRSRRSA